MTDMANAEFGEYAACVLDTYQDILRDRANFDLGADHRQHDEHAHRLLSSLITDLVHYADQRGIDFLKVLADANLSYLLDRVDTAEYARGSAVQLTRDAINQPDLAGLPRRGVVINIRVDQGQPTSYDVRSPGEQEPRQIKAEHLEAAPVFRPVTTYRGVHESVLDAEKALISTVARITVARIGISDSFGRTPSGSDIADQQSLLAALSDWTGIEMEELNAKLNPAYIAEMQRLKQEIDANARAGHTLPDLLEPTPPQLAYGAFPDLPLGNQSTDTTPNDDRGQNGSNRRGPRPGR